MGLQGELTLGDPVPTRTAHLVKGWAAAGKGGSQQCGGAMIFIPQPWTCDVSKLSIF